MRSLFSKEIYIRLTDDDTALICTSKYGRILSKTETFPLQRQPAEDTDAGIAAPRVSRWPRSLLGLTDEF